MCPALLHRRVAGVLVAATLCLFGGVLTGAAATAATGPAPTVVKHCTPPRPDPVVTVETFTGEPTCEVRTVTVGTVTTTQEYEWTWVPKPWDWGHHEWVLGTPTVVSDLHDVSLTAEEAALCDAGEKPDPLQEVQTFTAALDCDTPTAMVGDVVTTTDWVLDVQNGQWVPGEPVVDDQRTEISLTAEELAACEIPDQPDPVVEVVAFTAEPTCAAPTVLVGEVTTTTGWVLDEETSTWIPGEPVVDDQRVEVSLSAAELAACVPTQPTQPTQPVQPTAPTAPLALAQTGTPALLPALAALALALIGTTALVARRRLHT